MSELVVFAPEGMGTSDEEGRSFSTSSSDSLPVSPKFKSRSLKFAATPAKSLSVLKQTIGKCRQLISAEKEKISQLKIECNKLASKAGKLEASVREMQSDITPPKLVAEKIGEEKQKSLALEEEISGLKCMLEDYDEIKKAVKKAKDDISILNGNSLSSLSLSQCTSLFTQKCQAIEKLNEAINEKMQALEDSSLCIVCVSSVRSVILVPCGHLVLCWSCCECLRTCPVCRSRIEDKFRTETDW